MRIDLKKFLFIGPESVRATFFREAQQAGMIQFLHANTAKIADVPDAASDYAKALKILRGLPVREQVEMDHDTDADPIVRTIIALHDAILANGERLRALKLEMNRVEVFGDFSLEDIAVIEREGHRKVQFFCAKGQALDALEDTEGLIPIGVANGLHHFMAVNPQPKHYAGMLEMKIDRPLGDLENEWRTLIADTERLEASLKSQAVYNQFLHQAIITILNVHAYRVAMETPATHIEGKLFAVQGWVPVNKIAALQQLMQRLGVYADEIAIEPHDVVPTHLENEGFARIGEDLVKIYDIPSATDKDPSPWVLGFFILFFSMIVGDAGYGLIYLAIALYLRYRHPNVKGLGKRMLNLATMLAVGCIIWGVLTSSFFALPVDLNHPFRRASLITWLAEKKADYHVASQDATAQYWAKELPQSAGASSGRELLERGTQEINDVVEYPILSKMSDAIMVDLVIVVAITHLIISLLRYVRRNWAAVGWILFLIGAYLYFPKFLDATTMAQYLFGVSPERSEMAGFHLILIGLGLAVALSLIQNKLFGLLEITNVIQVAGDVMSYLRLYALGLAGAMVSTTINGIAAPLPIVFEVIVLALGHTINMGLGIMGGVIHGLRLNFLEWFHYSFQGDGKPFRPLQWLKLE
jgi:V/A-type H+-transporting ATPase subunit I